MRQLSLRPALAPLALLALTSTSLAQELRRAEVAPPAAAPALQAPEQEAEGPKPLPERGPKTVEGSLPLEWVEPLRWRSIGPANMGGRITDIAVNPDDPYEYWLGTATGGVVHTMNRGNDYEHQFEQQRVSSVGAIAVAPTNPDHVWVGTGEVNPRNSVSWGDGVYKSTDGGKTWGHAGLAESFQISTIVVHPEDEDVVYVGALGRLWGPNDQRGLYKTTDGGRTWERVLAVNEDTGIVEVKMHPTDPDTILVATYDRQRDMFDTNDPFRKWSEHSGIHRTTDGGRTWARVSEGLPTVRMGRIGMDWSRSNPDTVFAVVETERITQQRMDAAWLGVTPGNAELGVRLSNVAEEGPAMSAGLKEDDLVLRIADQPVIDRASFDKVLNSQAAGAQVTFEVIREGKLEKVDVEFGAAPAPEEDRFDVAGRPPEGPFGIGLGGQNANRQDEQGPEGFQHGGIFKSTDGGVSWARINSLNPRPMYYSEIRVDPSDDSYVYVLGTRLWRSKDGGTTFTPDGGNDGIHVDHHALWIDPEDGRHMILGNDGGIHVTWDRMDSWEHHNVLALGQFYNVTVGPRRDYRVFGGLQDNGSWGGPNRTGDGGPINEDWFRVGGGDGFVCRVDPTDPDLVYYESQNGGMGRRNLRTGEGGSLRPRGTREVRYRFNWNTPFLLSHHNPRIFYSAGSHVFRSIEQGSGQRAISPEITATERGAATALHESPMDQDLIYVGTDDGALWATRDGGTEWVDLMAINGAPAFEVKSVALAESPRARTVAAPVAQDRISGKWKARASGAGIESDDQGRFTLELTLGEGGAVTGTIASEIGSGAIEKGRFDAETGRLSFSFQGDNLSMDVTATEKDGELAGDIVALGGAFKFGWTAEREGGAPEAAAATGGDEVEEARPPREGRGDRPRRGRGERQEAGEGEERPRREVKDTIDQLLPGRRYVSDIKASRHRTRRVYVSFDGHRSDDCLPYVFVSEDAGESWKSLRGNLPDEAGSVRTILEDKDAANVLYLGCEFGAYVSVDGGESWTRLNSNLPTVPVHDLAQHELTGDLVAGTHGRSVWILDAPYLSQVTPEVLEADAHLFDPADTVTWRRALSRPVNRTQKFRGENPSSGASIYYSLGERARSVSLTVRDATGENVQTLEASGDKGLHRVDWPLTFTGDADASGDQRRRRFRGRRATPGMYVVTLTVGDRTLTQSFEVLNDPNEDDATWITFEEQWEELQAELDQED